MLQKSESFRVKASEGEVVVIYFKPSTTQDLKFSGFPANGCFLNVQGIIYNIIFQYGIWSRKSLDLFNDLFIIAVVII